MYGTDHWQLGVQALNVRLNFAQLDITPREQRNSQVLASGRIHGGQLICCREKLGKQRCNTMLPRRSCCRLQRERRQKQRQVDEEHFHRSKEQRRAGGGGGRWWCGQEDQDACLEFKSALRAGCAFLRIRDWHRDQWCKARVQEVQPPTEGHKIGGYLVQVNIERPLESH